MTELKGTFEIDLKWTPAEGGGMHVYDGVLSVLERQTGLHLEPRVLNCDVLVIDHLDRQPTAN
jgi:uncharacterized protein (TIGR03435 family)